MFTESSIALSKHIKNKLLERFKMAFVLLQDAKCIYPTYHNQDMTQGFFFKWSKVGLNSVFLLVVWLPNQD